MPIFANLAARAVAAMLAGGAGLLSGGLSLITTYGISMARCIVADDLVVVRAGTYDVGDVVAYCSPELRRVVLHRVVARGRRPLRLPGRQQRHR